MTPGNCYKVMCHLSLGKALALLAFGHKPFQLPLHSFLCDDVSSLTPCHQSTQFLSLYTSYTACYFFLQFTKSQKYNHHTCLLACLGTIKGRVVSVQNNLVCKLQQLYYVAQLPLQGILLCLILFSFCVDSLAPCTVYSMYTH